LQHYSNRIDPLEEIHTMSNETALEQRLSDLEQVVAVLQRQVNAQHSASSSQQTEPPQSQNWLEKLIGSISDEAAFLEAADYGRAYRQADRPSDEGLL
jgi:ribosome-binding ATPase YchF (GTP1/OBG family)